MEVFRDHRAIEKNMQTALAFGGRRGLQYLSMWLFKWVLLFLVAIPIVMIATGQILLGQDYRTANRDSAGIAPDPKRTPEAVVQVYAARALNWRGIFGVHTWIATKPESAAEFTVHQVIGWRLMRNLAGLFSEAAIPDRNWFGNRPELLADVRGPEAARAIEKILQAVETYPYADEYRLWPGPNSNTFTAYVARHVPELRLQLPVTAIGKDFPIDGWPVDRAPSGTGVQLTLYGLLGVIVGLEEGIELNVAALNFGVDVKRPALKLPFIGRIGFPVLPKTEETIRETEETTP
jgi:hypothetical protein